jgi:6-phosphofructokinase 1
VVGVPKTIDNDLSATEFTFGFDSAVDAATDAVDRLHATAESHHRVMFLEVMGRSAGWIALIRECRRADVILIPEIPYKVDSVIRKIRTETKGAANSALWWWRKGPCPKGTRAVCGDFRQTGPKRLGGAADLIAEQVFQKTGFETRTIVLGHLQRGGSPSAYDRILGTRFGAGAMRLVAQQKFG